MDNTSDFDTGRILHQDASCVVLNKLPGEALEADTDNEKSASSSFVLLPQVVEKALSIEKLYVVHRLDVPVSGCVLLAKDSETLAYLNTAFARGRVRKLYWTVVEKNDSLVSLLSSSSSGEMLHWISVDARFNKSHAHREPGHGRYESRLQWRLAGEGDNYAFLEIDLLTGRHHQIRAQLSCEGLHIKGDLKYGARRSEREGGIRLHSRLLSFPHPDNEGAALSILADPPRMDPLWEACKKACE